jgi:hypothetical protein
MSNIVSFKEAKEIEAEVNSEIEHERSKAVDTFNRAYSRYLRSKAKVLEPTPKRVGDKGKRYEAYVLKIDREYRALTALVGRTPAVLWYQINHKFDMLYDALHHDDADTARELAQSIQHDMRKLG